MKDFSHLELWDYLRIPWKRRWYFLAGTVIILAATATIAWLRPNYYRSETRIVAESATVLDDQLSASAVRDRAEERANAIRQLLESRTILIRIIEEFRLRSSDTSIPMEDALVNIRRNLDVSRASSGTFTMAYTASDPQVAQAITRRLAEILIQTNQSAQNTKAIEKDQFMDQELAQAKRDLDEIDARIKSFKATHLGELPEQATANMNALNGLQSQLMSIDASMDRARDQQKTLAFRIQEQQRLSALAKENAATSEPKTQITTPSPVESLLATKRAQLTEALSRFTPKHPDVIRLTKEVKELEDQVAKTSSAGNDNTPLGSGVTRETNSDSEISQLALSTESDIAQAKYELETIGKTIARREKEREGILKSINVYQNRLNLAPALEQEMLGLAREHDTKQQQVANLEARKFNSQMAANAVADPKNDIYRILDEASLPERPVFPSKVHIILIGIGLSLVAGFAAAFAREYFDPALADEEEAVSVLQLPVLACIPEIPESPGK
jgi:succinoglycan biosynthesis transport protein ExoP